MSDSLIALITGVLIFVLGQITIRFLIEPIQAYYGLVGEIAYALVMYANVGVFFEPFYLESMEKMEDSEKISDQIRTELIKDAIFRDREILENAKIKLRDQASTLMKVSSVIPFWSVWALVGILPNQRNIIDASSELVGMSNSIGKDSSTDRRCKIGNLLNIKIIQKKYGC